MFFSRKKKELSGFCRSHPQIYCNTCPIYYGFVWEDHHVKWFKHSNAMGDIIPISGLGWFHCIYFVVHLYHFAMQCHALSVILSPSSHCLSHGLNLSWFPDPHRFPSYRRDAHTSLQSSLRCMTWKYWLVRHLRHFLAAELINLPHRRVLCGKCLKCLTIQYWHTA